MNNDPIADALIELDDAARFMEAMAKRYAARDLKREHGVTIELLMDRARRYASVHARLLAMCEQGKSEK